MNNITNMLASLRLANEQEKHNVEVNSNNSNIIENDDNSAIEEIEFIDSSHSSTEVENEDKQQNP